MTLNIVMGCLIVGILCHANLPGYPDTLNITLKDKARLSMISRAFQRSIHAIIEPLNY